jgi:transcriptional regulator with XRE-family HTH domain
MKTGDNIRRVRTAKGLSQKEVTINSGLDTAQYSRIENGKTDPSVSTLERIAKAMGVPIADFFTETGEQQEINTLDKSLMEKVALIECLPEQEQQAIYTLLDAFVSKQKLKNALENVLNEV